MLDKPIRILQSNLNRSLQATESALEVAVQRKIDIVAVQEPWLTRDKDGSFRNTRSIAHNSYNQILPRHANNTRPRTLLYIKKDLGLQVTSETPPYATEDPDIQILHISDQQGKTVQLINVYNERDTTGNWTSERTLIQLTPAPNTILLGDF
ncbi:MAG: hypothetical protein FE78DRAFT_389946, partial [Acidomyces sp. 'richmondensis']